MPRPTAPKIAAARSDADPTPIAVIAMGFTGIAGEAAYMARILFFVFLVLFLVSVVLGRAPSGESLP